MFHERLPSSLFLLICVVAAPIFSPSTEAQTKWFRYKGNPVLKPGPDGAWDSRMVWIDKVIVKDSRYHVWYSGDGSLYYAIGYATSADGITWTKHTSNPVLKQGLRGSWEGTGARNPNGFFEFYPSLPTETGASESKYVHIIAIVAAADANAAAAWHDTRSSVRMDEC